MSSVGGGLAWRASVATIEMRTCAAALGTGDAARSESRALAGGVYYILVSCKNTPRTVHAFCMRRVESYACLQRHLSSSSAMALGELALR